MLGNVSPMSSSSTSLEVVIKVIGLDSQGNLVAGLADVPDVIHVWSLLIVCEKTKGIHDSFRESVPLENCSFIFSRSSAQ